MRLLRIPEPFDHSEFVYEAKLDGFRALAYVTSHRCELVSRNGHRFKSWPQLAEEIAHAVKVRSAVLDGEICCLESDGRPNFHALLFRREWPYFYAFDLYSVNGEIYVACRCSSASGGCWRSCRQLNAASCISITWWSADAISSGWHASAI
jgi:ATP-dependent DNA ligase